MIGWVVALVLLFMIGLILVWLELFVIPGFGLVGVLGILALLGGALLAFSQVGTAGGIIALLVALGGTALLFWLGQRSRFARGMVLNQSVRAQAPDETLALLVGRVGRAATPLRPSGTVLLADRTVDVVTDCDFVEAGTPVRITRVEGARVTVEPVAAYEKGEAQ